ncbi:MAG: GNAT family N-acetyltransferase [Neisseria sp.]
MSSYNPNEIIIHGTTSTGKVFRPSDWAERLCGILSSFDQGNRLAYHKWVSPMLVDQVRSVAVDKKLEEINPVMFRFLLDFAHDNDLRVMEYEELKAEEDNKKNGVVPHIKESLVAVEEATPAVLEPNQATVVSIKTGIGSSLREITAEETATTFATLSMLRPMLTDVSRFVEQVNELQRPRGYRLLGIFEEGKTNAVAVCGFREEANLVSGRHMHIDEIVTIPQSRGRGYAARLLAEVHRVAVEAGINQIHIDSNVGTERASAHRLYFLHGFEITAHHFICDVKNFR